MNTPSYTDVSTALISLDPDDTFSGVAEDKTLRCSNDIPHYRLWEARALVQQDSSGYTHREHVKRVKDIIALLVCEEHQCNKSYTYKDAVRDKWQSEFPEFDFKLLTRSRYSLSSSRGSTPAGASPNTPLTRSPSFRSTPPTSLTPSRSEQQTPVSGSNSRQVPLSSDDQQHSGSGMSQQQTSDTGLRLLPPPRFALPVSVGEGPTVSGPIHDELPQQTQDEMVGVEAEPGNNANDVFQPTPVDGRSTDPVPRVEQEVTSSRRSSRGNRAPSSRGVFRPGDASSWSPWTIRSEVRSLILEPLPKPRDKGCLYIIQNARRTHVKIGYTMRPFRTRLQEIARDVGVPLDLDNPWHLSGIPHLQLLRLEALVHADLAFFQRDLIIGMGSTRRTRREWFEVEMADAQRTVRLWWDIMRKIRMEPGVEIDPSACEALTSSSAFDVSMSGVADQATPFADVNNDHNGRIEMWTQLLLSRRTSGHLRTESILKWLGGCVLVLGLPTLLGVDTAAASTLSFFLVAVWTRHMASS
ncbi:hypothetical protein BAUCODRAFT_244346 [Baudoinia panamericana UAMH 10762]|uniref:Bacteriophage T5 Orf172 DNA-binding domain-containing protein n=1 Tax=Baudoinia panamericana (strain UAMH 10762) TaxID=717646 RepID=M2LHB1_BAUPA|nr:uncharacterized protein BAUCODRAFT_244346 [Baudoinia panamericana UAMH 10762]EMC93517.1 hypothetical protein BAUCODRAFT_244346 [Baudoinia panamericana UAMH 10762]